MTQLMRSLNLSRLFVAVLFLAVFAMALRTPLDTDMLWHLRAGEWQWQNAQILRTDYFSTSRYGESWINHSWLSQYILYGAYRIAGYIGLSLYTAILATAGMAFVYRQSNASVIVRAFVIVLAASAAALFWSPRPQMMSFFFSTIVLYLLWLYRVRSIDRLWFIPLLMVLWANLHGGFAIAFELMVLALIGELAHWLFESVLKGAYADVPSVTAAIREDLKPVFRLVVIGLVSAAAISLNPYGPRMLLYPFDTVGMQALKGIQEWSSPDFHSPSTWPFIWLLLGAFALVGLTPRRLDWRDAVMVAGMAYASLLAGRNIATFAVVVSPLVMTHLDDFITGAGVSFNLNRRPQGVLAAINWLILLLCVAAVAVKGYAALSDETIQSARDEFLPVAAARYLETHDVPQPVFNSYNWGGFLIWEARSYLVYVDGRTDLYNDDILLDYLFTHAAQPGWQERLDETGANSVIIEPSSPLAQVLALTEGWLVAYEDDFAVIFVREAPLAD